MGEKSRDPGPRTQNPMWGEQEESRGGWHHLRDPRRGWLQGPGHVARGMASMWGGCVFCFEA